MQLQFLRLNIEPLQSFHRRQRANLLQALLIFILLVQIENIDDRAFRNEYPVQNFRLSDDSALKLPLKLLFKTVPAFPPHLTR